jgi:hypothetical protein
MTETKQEDSFEPTPAEVAAAKKAAIDAGKEKKGYTLKDTSGKPVDSGDYFFSTTDKKYPLDKDIIKNYIGEPVTREDLIAIFNEVFKPELGVLFYKKIDTEVYIVIIPIKYSSTVSRFHESGDGAVQIHSISQIAEGSVNIDAFRAKLKRIVPFCEFVK